MNLPEWLKERREIEKRGTEGPWQFQATTLLGPSVTYDGNTGAGYLGEIDDKEDLALITDLRNNAEKMFRIIEAQAEALGKAVEALLLFNGNTRLALIDDPHAEANVSRALDLQAEVESVISRAEQIINEGET